MRTTLILDDEIAARLAAEAWRSRRSFGEVVNSTLRMGLAAQDESVAAARFRIKARDLGELRPGISLDKVSALADQLEGSRHD